MKADGYHMPENLKLKLVTEPQNLPMSLNEAKAFLKLGDDDTDDDALIMAMLRAAVRHVETFTGRALITQTWRLTLDRWPSRSRLDDQLWEGVREAADIVEATNFIEIPKPPLRSVGSFQVFDSSDAASTVATTVYFVDGESQPGRVGLRHGQTWPSTTLRPHNGIQITFVAGYADDANGVPDDILAGLRLLLAHFHANRAACDQATNLALPVTAKEVLRPYRILRL